MIKLQESNITHILPVKFKNDPKNKALGYALANATKRLIKYEKSTSVYARIDTASNEVLDMLAAEFNTQYYDTSLGIESKRQLVKNALIWHMTSGTPAAVEELITAVFGEGEIKEWFEYGDEPYYFKVITNALLTENINNQFTSILEEVKNTRSHIRAIEIHREVNLPYTSGACVHANTKPAAIIDGYSVKRDAQGNIMAGVAGHTVAHPVPVRDGFKVNGNKITTEINAGAGSSNTTHQAAIIDGYSEAGARVIGTINTGAASTLQIKPSEIRESMTFKAPKVNQATSAGIQADSRYKNTIKEQEE